MTTELAENITPLSRRELISSVDCDRLIPALADPARYLLETTGKNLRSQIVLHSAMAGPEPHSSLIRRGAIAVELIHLATLAHDDVVDDGRVRRGMDAIEVVYGSCASGFVGGLIFARAGELIAECGSEPTLRFAGAAQELALGQMMEFEDLFDLSRSAERYYTAIEWKTASLFSLSAWLGAWLAGADEDTVLIMSRFAHEYGIAFQMADDILDFVASEAKTGKAQGKDLQQGVYTLPVIYALKADSELRSALEEDVGASSLPDLTSRVKASGGIELATEECLQRSLRARELLESLDGVCHAGLGDRLATLLDSALERLPYTSIAGANGNGARN